MSTKSTSSPSSDPSTGQSEKAARWTNSKKWVERIEVREITRDPKALCPMARRFHDPFDRRYEAEIHFNPSAPHLDFHIGRIIQAITDQDGVKHLLPIEEAISYTFTLGTGQSVHGHNVKVYDGIVQLPIRQEVPEGTQYSLAMDNTSGTECITILSDKLEPVDKSAFKGILCNRRAFLFHLYPGEKVEARYKVGTSTNFSIKESTHFTRPRRNALVIGTQLDTPPKDLMKRVLDSWVTKAQLTVNNPLVDLAHQSGLGEEVEALQTETVELRDAILEAFHQ